MAPEPNSLFATLDLDPQRLLKRITLKGAQFIEFFFERTYQTSIRSSDQVVERAIEGMDLGVGLRMINKGQTYYAYSNRIDDALLGDWFDHLLSHLEIVAPHEKASVSAPKPGKSHTRGRRRATMPPSQSSTSMTERLDIVREAEAGVREGKVKNVKTKVDYFDHLRQVSIINSEGLSLDFEQEFHLLTASAIAEKGNRREVGYEPLGGAFGFGRLQNDAAYELGKKARQQAERLLQARSAPVGSMPVVIRAAAGGTLIHEAIGHGLEADLTSEGLSVYSHKLGKRIASKEITVIDDPRLPHLGGSYAYDDEGTPAQETLLIDKGVLLSFIQDRLNATQAGLASTGNGRRESYQSRPIPRMSNIYLKPGQEDPKSILSSVKKGLWVEQMGGGEVDTVTGSFVFEVTEAYLIRKGEIAEPVRGATLIGNALEFLKQDLVLGNDLGFALGICEKDGQEVFVSDAQPTLLIPNLTVGGQG